MKKNYVRPTMIGERFAANEYVATCGENITYYFKCNAPAGTLYYYPESDGKVDGTYTGNGRAEQIGSYYPCSAEPNHPVSQESRFFYDGFVDYNNNNKCDAGEEVIVWSYIDRFMGVPYRQGHATKELDMSKWEKNRS